MPECDWLVIAWKAFSGSPVISTIICNTGTILDTFYPKVFLQRTVGSQCNHLLCPSLQRQEAQVAQLVKARRKHRSTKRWWIGGWMCRLCLYAACQCGWRCDCSQLFQTEAIVLLQSVRMGEELSLTGSFAQKGRQLERLCSGIEVCEKEGTVCVTVWSWLYAFLCVFVWVYGGSACAAGRLEFLFLVFWASVQFSICMCVCLLVVLPLHVK